MIKNNFAKISLLSALFLTATTTFTSCSKDEEVVTPTTNTITDVVVANSSFSLLKKAVLKAKLETTLSGTGPFTVFAPDDAAFAASGVTSATIDGMTETETKSLLLYHTLTSKILAANVPAGPNAKVLTAEGDSVFVTNNSNGVFVNGIKVTTANIAADNGVIHSIGKVLFPAKGNIVQTAQAVSGGDNGLDSLVVAVLRATNGPGGVTTLAGTLSTSTLTVFAPTNKAFRDLLAALGLTKISDIPMPTLLAALQYHVVVGRAFSSDLTNGSLSMLAGGNTTTNLSNGTGGAPTITGNGNGSVKSNIIATNVVCRNGVVHVIDRVLLP